MSASIPDTLPNPPPVDNNLPQHVENEEYELPPTRPDVWGEVNAFRQRMHEQVATPRELSVGGTSHTQSMSDNPEEHDSESIATISDHFFGIDPTMRGLPAQTILDAPELVEHATNGTYLYNL